MSIGINEMTAKVHSLALECGWWINNEEDKPFLSPETKLSKHMLFVTEVAEASEEVRNKKPALYQIYVPDEDDQNNAMELEFGEHTVLVDRRDYEEFSQKFHFYISHDGNNPYLKANHEGSSVSFHNLIVNPPKGQMVDHWDGNTLNNLRHNLRACTPSQNQANQKVQSRVKASRFKGVTLSTSSDKKFRAQIGYEGKRFALGHFNTEEEAAKAYDVAAVNMFGQFAKLNFPVPEIMTPIILPGDRRWSDKLKTEGELSELADIVIRVMDYAGFCGFDLEAAILAKHDFNKTRAFRHGGKAL